MLCHQVQLCYLEQGPPCGHVYIVADPIRFLCNGGGRVLVRGRLNLAAVSMCIAHCVYPALLRAPLVAVRLCCVFVWCYACVVWGNLLQAGLRLHHIVRAVVLRKEVPRFHLVELGSALQEGTATEKRAAQ